MLIASPVNRTGRFTSSNIAEVEYNTKHTHNINIQHTNIIMLKLVPSVLLM